MTDNEIIEHLRNNNYAAAIKGLYNGLPPVKQYIKANSGTAEDAKDIFQDALVIVYKKVQHPEFILSVPLKTYLLAVVKNCWWQELRRRKKMPPGEPPAEIIALPPDEEPAFQTATAAFNLLGDKCRELLLLFYYKKKSFKEIAKVFAFSDERVAKNQKYRCMEKAKENYLILSKMGTHG
jgi:RNA polymerase sigma factor (sigma-70 family)